MTPAGIFFSSPGDCGRAPPAVGQGDKARWADCVPLTSREGTSPLPGEELACAGCASAHCAPSLGRKGFPLEEERRPRRRMRPEAASRPSPAAYRLWLSFSMVTTTLSVRLTQSAWEARRSEAAKSPNASATADPTARAMSVFRHSSHVTSL